MLTIICSGTPFENGQIHGSRATKQIHSSIAFYTAFFQETAQISYVDACHIASKFLPYLTSNHPDLVEEMRGVAEGASVPFERILALNVRTEISYGLATIQGLMGKSHGEGITDGCTAFSWHDGNSGFLAQNWDWREAQSSNLIRLKIMGTKISNGSSNQSSQPTTEKRNIDIITEAGIIGKIGLNSAGVGVCLNAIRAPGVDHNKLPVHLALRSILDYAGSTDDALKLLSKHGVASSSHILVSDQSKAIGLETSLQDIVQVTETKTGNIATVSHTNHYIKDHKDVNDGGGFLIDSPDRLARIQKLMSTGGSNKVKLNDVKGWLKDEEGLPVSICRQGTEGDSIETLFSIVMDLKGKKGYVKAGRPTQDGEELELDPLNTQ